MTHSMIDGLHFQASLPLIWRETCNQSAFEGARYLAVLAEFEQSAAERAREKEDLHAKLDLALLWLARSLAGDMPQTRVAWVGLESLVWIDSAPLTVGMTGALHVNLSTELPFLLQLPARVLECRQSGDGWQIHAELQIQDESLRDGWERTVFRRHRRMIQQERGGQA